MKSISVPPAVARNRRDRSGLFDTGRASLRQVVADLGPLLLVCLAAVAYQHVEGTHTDVSWLITLSERLLDGQRPYVDFFEVNPPASILLYVPSVFVGRLTSIPPELVVKASVCLLFFGCLRLSRRVSGAGGDATASVHTPRHCEERSDEATQGSRRGPSASGLLRYARNDGRVDGCEAMTSMRGIRLALYAAIFLLIPGNIFAEREHYVAIALLPILAVLVQRAENRSVRPGDAILAGITAGVAIAVKPHHALAVLAPLYLVLWRGRGGARELVRRALAPELLAMAGVALLYFAVVQLCFPAFLSMTMPIVLDIYVVFRRDLSDLLLNWNCIVWAATVFAVLRFSPDRGYAARHAVPLLASGGCLLAWFIQGKSWPYQGYPAVAIALAVLADIVVERWRASPPPRRPANHAGRALPAVILVLLMARSAAWYYEDPRGLAPLRTAMGRLAPHPRLMAIAPMLSFGHPLVREIGGTWVGHLSSTWTYVAATILLQEPTLSAQRRQRLLQYVKLEKDQTAADIVAFRPDYILVAKEFSADDPRDRPSIFGENWTKSTPALVAALADYGPVAEADLSTGKIVVWGRTDARARAGKPAPSKP